MGTGTRSRTGTAIAILYIFLWASAYVPSKIASVETDPLWFLVVRSIVAGSVLAAIALAIRQRIPTTAGGWFVASAIGVLANAIYLGLTYTAMQHHLSSGMGAIIASMNPLVLALVAPRWLGERLTPFKALGLTLGFGGVVALVFARNGTGTAAPFDVALAFVGVCASVAATILYKRAGTAHGLVAISAIQLLAAGIALAPVAASRAGFPHVAFTWELVAAFVYLVVVISGCASLLWFWLLSNGEASRVSAYFYLTPVFGLALSAALLHERIEAADLIGLTAIAAGIALVQRA